MSLCIERVVSIVDHDWPHPGKHHFDTYASLTVTNMLNYLNGSRADDNIYLAVTYDEASQFLTSTGGPSTLLSVFGVDASSLVWR